MTRILPRIALVIGAVAVCCAAAEVMLRLRAPRDTPGMFTPVSSPVEYTGRPHASGFLQAVPVTFNGFGLRDRERAIDRAPGTIRIIILGDSVTFGVGVREDDTYPRVTETLVNSAREPGSPPVEILNFAMPGYNTLHELAQLRELGLTFRPDVVLVGFLYNDVELSDAQRHDRAAAEPLSPAEIPSRSVATSLRSRINAAIVSLKQWSLLVAWLTPRVGLIARRFEGAQEYGQVGEFKRQFTDGNPDWLRVQAALLEMKQLCEAHGAQLVVAIIPAMAQFTAGGYPIKEYHDALLGFCRASSIPCLDLLPAFWGLDGSEFWISPTDGHPNAAAHRIIAEALSAFLAPLLRHPAGVAHS